MGLGPVQPSKSPDFPEDRSLDNNSARKEENGTIQKTNSVSARRFGKGRNELKSEKGFRENLSSNQAPQQSDQTPEQQVATKEVPLEEKPPTEESSQETPQEVNQAKTSEAPPLLGREIEQHEAPDISDFAVSILEVKPRDSEETFHASNGIKTHPPKIDKEETFSSESSQPISSENKVESEKESAPKETETEEVSQPTTSEPSEIKPKEKHVEFVANSGVTEFSKTAESKISPSLLKDARVGTIGNHQVRVLNPKPNILKVKQTYENDFQVNEVVLSNLRENKSSTEQFTLIDYKNKKFTILENNAHNIATIQQAGDEDRIAPFILPAKKGGAARTATTPEQRKKIEAEGGNFTYEIDSEASSEFKKKVKDLDISEVVTHGLNEEQSKRLGEILRARIFEVAQSSKTQKAEKEEEDKELKLEANITTENVLKAEISFADVFDFVTLSEKYIQLLISELELQLREINDEKASNQLKKEISRLEEKLEELKEKRSDENQKEVDIQDQLSIKKLSERKFQDLKSDSERLASKSSEKVLKRIERILSFSPNK